MNSSARSVVVLLGILSCSLAPEAAASVSMAVELEELTAHSAAIAVISPLEQQSRWEGRAIITHTRVRVDDTIAGPRHVGDELWLVTRGGTVGTVGQLVDGEATFRVGQPALVFVRERAASEAPSSSGTFAVTARAQGTFHIEGPPESPHATLMASQGAGVLLPRPVSPPRALRASAREVLHRMMVADARLLIAKAWRTKEKKK